MEEMWTPESKIVEEIWTPETSQILLEEMWTPEYKNWRNCGPGGNVGRHLQNAHDKPTGNFLSAEFRFQTRVTMSDPIILTMLY